MEKEFFEANKATLAYPNDKGDFYTDNKYMSGDEDPLEAILKERMREFYV
ncbi:RagB/SusD family nutrient uptake outer membrane protein [Bacteroides fragilis]|nr:RagB/SusD family nutrient uptake outer membrane protein [Bacteroides fragilis]